MQVKINLEEDKELRDAVRRLMESQVKSLTREHIREAIEGSSQSEVVSKTLKQVVYDHIAPELRKTNMQYLIKACIKEIIEEQVRGKVVLPDAITIKVQPLIEAK